MEVLWTMTLHFNGGTHIEPGVSTEDIMKFIDKARNREEFAIFQPNGMLVVPAGIDVCVQATKETQSQEVSHE